MCYSSEKKIAIEAAIAAGKELKKRENISIKENLKRDIKLSSDNRSEEIILEILKRTGRPILSEECGSIGEITQDTLYWIVDPLDGTVNYYRNSDELSCVSIALWKGTQPVLGVVYRFAVDEMFFGIVNEGAYLNSKRIHTSNVSSISEAIGYTGFPAKYDFGEKNLCNFAKTIWNFKKIRMLGTAATMGAFVAAGRADMYFEDNIMLWDIAAATAIVVAAGGVADIEVKNDKQCICKLFANDALRSDFYAKGL